MSDNNNISYDSNSGEPLKVTILVSGYEETEPRFVSVTFNNEGIIMDFHKDTEMQATVGMLYDEWLDMARRSFK